MGQKKSSWSTLTHDLDEFLWVLCDISIFLDRKLANRTDLTEYNRKVNPLWSLQIFIFQTECTLCSLQFCFVCGQTWKRNFCVFVPSLLLTRWNAHPLFSCQHLTLQSPSTSWVPSSPKIPSKNRTIVVSPRRLSKRSVYCSSWRSSTYQSQWWCTSTLPSLSPSTPPPPPSATLLLLPATRANCRVSSAVLRRLLAAICH